MNWKIWIKAAAIRAVKTICQTAVAIIAVGVPIYDMDWKNILAVSLTAGVCSMLTSVAGLPEVPEDE